MTVRWKPLIVLSALFLVIGVMGLLAITYALVPGKAEDLLPRARAAAKAGRFDDAEIQYKRALQRDPKKGEIHEEFAEMIGRWMEQVPSKKAELRDKRTHELVDAAKYGKGRPGPLKSLLVEALAQDDLAQAIRRADELLAIDTKDADAHFAKALEALQSQPPNPAEAKVHLAALREQEPTKLRTLWVQALAAREAGDEPGASAAIAEGRAMDPKAPGSSSERLARLRLLSLAIGRGSDLPATSGLVAEFAAGAREMAADAESSPARIRVLTALLDQVQKQLTAIAAREPSAKKAATALSDSLEPVAEAIFGRALTSFGASDLRAHLDYAEHLAFRDQVDKAKDVAVRALKLPMAAAPTWEVVANGLRDVAVRSILAKADDPKRFDAAAPHIQALIAGTNPRATGLGHLYQGLIALDRSNLAIGVQGDAESKARPMDPKRRDEAVAELKLAADLLPDAATPRALYGVALILSGEAEIGRQHLQSALKRSGDRLEPRYQVFAAWSILRAGYPEVAAPIVARMLEGAAKGEVSREVAPTLHMLMGQIHQARHDYPAARAEYQKSLDGGQPVTEALLIRMAQVEMLSGEESRGMDRLAKLKSPSAERLMVQALNQNGKDAAARKALDQARARFPDADELVELDAVMHLSADQAPRAEALLAGYLAKHPGRDELAMLRARILAGPLKKADEGRKVLADLAEKAATSAPLVELARLDLTRNDLDGVRKSVARLRARWPEAAVADLLDAQVALANQQPQAAAALLDSALKKDPSNKVALFWKATLDDRSGATAKAAQAYESILKDRPLKEISADLSLTNAAKWALADMALKDQDLDGAIARFEGLLKGDGAGELDRAVRWKLVAAHAAKGRVVEARAEVAKLVADPKTTIEERVQAAEFYRNQGDEAACMAQLDRALKEKPSHTGAVSYRAMVLASQGKAAEAAASIRRAIVAEKQPANLYLMLAAVENLDAKDGPGRALKALDEGLAAHPDSIVLAQLKYQVLSLRKDPRAVAFIEDMAKADRRPEMRRLLAEVYRSEKRPEEAATVLRDLLQETPRDARLAAALVGLTSARAVQAGERGDRAGEREFNNKAADLIRQFRERFPAEPSFLEAECELAARTGDLARAKRLCGEISTLDPQSPAGPILKARVYALENRPDEVAKAYDEALARAPRRIDLRLASAQANLALGKADEAMKQAKFVLDADPKQPTATLLRAQALAAPGGSAEAVGRRRGEAARSLQAAIAANPRFVEAYHQLAQVRVMQGDRAGAVAVLRSGLKAVPEDDAGLSSLVQVLCQPRQGKPAPPADVQEAMKLAEDFGNRDPKGIFALALAVGFHSAGKTDLAMPWAEKAAEKIDRPIVHLSYGDILLAKAEATTVESDAKEVFRKALEQYDRVLKEQANDVGAINNKAWILHRYFGKNSEALDVAEDLVRRSDPASLPAEFFDTLGSIRVAMNRKAQAEEAYEQGLRKAPATPLLNYHLGKLLADDPDRQGKARQYLEKAQAAKAKLAPADVADLDRLLKVVSK